MILFDDVPCLIVIERAAGSRGEDSVLAFYDIRACIVADLARAGVAVRPLNRRDVAGIVMIRTGGAHVSAGDRAEAPVRGYEERLATVTERARGRPRPRVYFEQWGGTPISGIGWVSQPVRVAGGDGVFPKPVRQPAAKGRIVAPEAVLAAAPEVIPASLCGKSLIPSRIASRPGWASMPTVVEGRIVEIGSTLLLRLGPAAPTMAWVRRSAGRTPGIEA